MSRLISATALTIVVLCAAMTVVSDDNTTLNSMNTELDRDIKQLSLDNFEKPYFIAYTVEEDEGRFLMGRFGALIHDQPIRERKIYADVRVGDYSFDSSMPVRRDFDSDDLFNKSYQYISAPFESDAKALRGMFWLMTDLKYKQALTDFMNKKMQAVRKIQMPEEKSDDFTREKPLLLSEPPLSVELSKEYFADLVRRASKLLAEYRGITESQVSCRYVTETQYFISTEGARIVTRNLYWAFSADATAHAADGTPLGDSVNYYARSKEGIPKDQEMMESVDKMAKELLTLKDAPEMEPFTGPAILGPTVTGVFFHEAIGHRLEAHRTRSDEEGQTFKGKLGQEVIPKFLDVSDDPTMLRAYGSDLNGYYKVDDEGVAAQRVNLIESGVLKDFLMSRMPIPSRNKSNGHGRASIGNHPTPRMGNLIVTAHNPVSRKTLEARLIKLAKAANVPYGLIIDTAMSGETSTDKFQFQAFLNRPILVYRVDVKTGKRTLVRGADIVGTPLLSIKNIVAAGDDYKVQNGYCGSESGFVPTSMVAPSVLVRQLELQRSAAKPSRPPILPSPFEK